MTQFATADEFATRLGIDLTTNETNDANTLLTLASALIQEEAGQVIELVGEDTLTRPGSYAARIRLPERPVLSVTSVTLDGVAIDDDAWYLDGDEIVRTNLVGTVGQNRFGSFGLGWGAPSQELVIVYSHGYNPTPVAAKAVCLEMVARVWVNPGSVLAEVYGSQQVTYQRSSGLLLTEDERRTIRDAYRRTAGSAALR